MATTSNEYDNGDMVDIVNGKYKGMKATYLHKYGTVMCTVAINGVPRNIWLSSITARKHDDKKPKVSERDDSGKTGTRRKEDMKKLQRSIEDMKVQLDLMQASLDSLMLDDNSQR